MATFWPSTNPASPKPRWNAPTKCAELAAAALRRNPITGIAGCWACATSGHVVAAPLKSVMTSRRFHRWKYILRPGPEKQTQDIGLPGGSQWVASRAADNREKGVTDHANRRN